jgi:hypothetical protein
MAVGAHYFNTLGAGKTVTFSGTPTEGSSTSVKITTTASITFTFPASKRSGGANSNITSFDLLSGYVYTLAWTYIGGEWVLTDSVGIESGTQGAQGAQGATGAQGVAGATGAQGPQGVDGGGGGTSVPDYGIILYPRALDADLPEGFLPCDGSEGTPTVADIGTPPNDLMYIQRTVGVAPELSSATIETDGETATLVFTEAVTGSGSGFGMDMSGGGVTMTYVSGSGTDTLVFSLSRTVLDDETGTIAYTPGNWVDGIGLALASFTGELVTNNSTQVAGSSIPTFVGINAGNMGFGQNVTAQYPTVEENDIMLHFLAIDSNQPMTGTPPSGWALVFERATSPSNGRLGCWWKRAGSSEPASELWSTIVPAATSGGRSVVVAYRGCVTTGSPVDALNDGGGEGTSQSIDLTTTVDNTVVVAAFGGDPGSNPTNITWNSPIVERCDGSTTPSGQNGTLGCVIIGDIEVPTAGLQTMGGTLNSTMQCARIVLSLKP